MDDCILPATGSTTPGIAAIAAIALLVGVCLMFLVRRHPGAAVVLLLVAATIAMAGSSDGSADAAANCSTTTTTEAAVTPPTPTTPPPTTTPPTTAGPTTTSTTSTTTTSPLRPPTAVDDEYPAETGSHNILSNDDLGDPTARITEFYGYTIDADEPVTGQDFCAGEDVSWYATMNFQTGAINITQIGSGEYCDIEYTITNSEGSSTATIRLLGDPIEPPR